MGSITITVPAVPVAQPRPRAFAVAGRARMADAPKTHAIHAFRASVRMAWQLAYQGPPLEGPLELTATFVMPRPKSRIWKSRPMPREPYMASRNDWDNLGKGVCDALNQVAYRDDGQIVRAVVERWIAAGDEQPHCLIVVTPLEEAA